MALTDLKITSEKIQSNGLVAAPDVLTGTAAENKALFDKLVREIVAVQFNALVDELTNNGAASIGAMSLQGQTTVQAMIDAGVFSEDVKNIRLNEDKVLETSANGVEWEATGSSGHLIIAPDGQPLPQRSRLKFANGTVTDDGTQTVVTGLKGDKGEKGDRGERGVQGERG